MTFHRTAHVKQLTELRVAINMIHIHSRDVRMMDLKHRTLLQRKSVADSLNERFVKILGRSVQVEIDRIV